MSFAKVMWRYNGDVNSASGENWKEPPSSTILTDSSFNGDSNEENLNANLLLLIQNLLAIRENKTYENITYAAEGDTGNFGKGLHL